MNEGATDAILIFSLPTGRGTFRISTGPETFRITLLDRDPKYHLTNDGFPEFRATYRSPYDAVRAVAEHRSGLGAWDSAGERASDYAGDWQRHADKRFQMRLLSDFLDRQPSASMRTLVDYFERHHSYLMDRMVVHELFEELILTAAIPRLPSMYCAPAEFHSLERMAAQFLSESGDAP